MLKRGSMCLGELSDELRWMNPRIRIFGGDGLQKGKISVYYWAYEFDPWGLMEHRSQGNWRQVCGISNGGPVTMVPERTLFCEGATKVWKRGWREIVSICKDRGYVNIPNRLGGNGGILKHGRTKNVS